MKKVIILGAGEMQIPVIKKVSELGYCSIALDYDADAVGLKYADKSYVVSSTDVDKVFEVAQKENVDALLTTSDYPVNVVAAVSEAMGLVSMPKEVAHICTNKFLQRELFSSHGINSPEFCLVSDNGISVEKYNNYPYIVKPVDSSASRGVKKVNNSDELVKAVEEAKEYSRSRKVLVEQFIGGKEYSVETLTQNRKTTIVSITEKLVIGEGYGCFVEDTHIEPARITKEEWILIESEVVRALNAIQIDNSPSHTEVKLWNGKPYIIEMACRLGGDYITSDLVPLSTGVDMLKNLVNCSLGFPIDVSHKYEKCAAVQFINQDNYQRCINFLNASQSMAVASFEVKPYSDKLIKSSLDRLGYIILQTDTMEELEDILRIIK